MTSFKPASWTYANQFTPEPPQIEAARERGAQLGATPVAGGVGPALRMLAATLAAKAVVEIGTGAGSSGLWLLAGMPADGILTTIDVEAEHQKAARQAYRAAGVAHQRTRVIAGDALAVMDRMTDGAYDLVVIDADKESYPAYVERAVRLLRRGGALAIDNMLWHDKVADPAARDETTRSLRDLGKALRDDEALTTTLLPVGDGLLVAVRR